MSARALSGSGTLAGAGIRAGVGSGTGVSVEAEELIALRAHMLRVRDRGVTASALPGGFAVSRRGNGQVIADSRLYIHGDDMRHVDRGATARTGDLHVRTFHEERDRITFLVADFRPSMLWGMRRAFRSVAAAQALAWRGWQAVEAGGRVGLLAVTARERFLVPSRPRTSGMLAVIGGLVRAHVQAVQDAEQGADDPELCAALSGLDRIVARGSEVVIASAFDHCGAGFEAALGQLARYRTPRLLVVEERALRDLPAGYYPLSRPGRGKARAFFRSDPQRGSVVGADRVDAMLAPYVSDYIDAGRALMDEGV